MRSVHSHDPNHKRVVAASSSSVLFSSASFSSASSTPVVSYAVPEALKDLPKHILSTVDHTKLLLQKDYIVCPQWAAAPGTGWKGKLHLEAVVRRPTTTSDTTTPHNNNNDSGSSTTTTTTVARYMVDRYPYYLFGTHKRVVDHCIEHPSFSRVHMALIHHVKLGAGGGGNNNSTL